MYRPQRSTVCGLYRWLPIHFLIHPQNVLVQIYTNPCGFSHHISLRFEKKLASSVSFFFLGLSKCEILPTQIYNITKQHNAPSQSEDHLPGRPGIA
jgi:hypothetical protein